VSWYLAVKFVHVLVERQDQYVWTATTMSALAEGFRVVRIPANQIRWEEFGPR